MSVVDDAQEIDVQPHPRLLSVLGDIEFAPWQCLAELVDNAFDEFLRHPAPSAPTAAATEPSPGDAADLAPTPTLDQRENDPPTVTVTLPSKGSDDRSAEVWVCDNGSGMGLTQLNSALRAGWSSNDRFGQLGLYGVGFNIATARLGYIAVVKTTRAGDRTWTVVTLDLRQLARGDHYKLPVTHEPKSSSDEHGTQVIIRDLKPEYRDSLVRPQTKTKIRSILGEVYSHLLSERGFLLVVDRVTVAPRRPCVWGSDRFVVRSNERIPAVIKIDQPLADQHVCMECGRWQEDLEGRCESCGSERLEVRERRIWGWVGIQRYLHATDFGIDFIRNGRKILLHDQSIFQWRDPDDPSARGESEYPVEFPRNVGRIVGEIHIDHVRVNYQKNAFEYDSREWKRVVRELRGKSPLRPKIAKDAGFTEPNTSPLARLFAGYRENEPGLRCLIPGDGKVAMHTRALEWAKSFREGDEDFQSDERWYQQAEDHDKVRAELAVGGGARPGPTPPTPVDPGTDLLRAKGLLDPAPTPTTPAPVPKQESEEERRERWRAAGQRQGDLETTYNLPGHAAVLKASVYLVRGHRLLRPDGEHVPVYLSPGRGSTAEVFIDADHEIFTDFAVDTRDLVLMEIADHLRVHVRSERALSGLFSDLKAKCLPDHKINGVLLGEAANRLLTRITEGMQPVIVGNSAGYWSSIAVEDQEAAQRRHAMEGGVSPWDELVENGEWVQHVPAKALVRLVVRRPEAFLDRRVFRSAYGGLPNPQAKAVSAERIERLLGDVAILADQAITRGTEELQRGRLSCTLLERELVAVEDVEG